jgi:hypothetical protein
MNGRLCHTGLVWLDRRTAIPHRRGRWRRLAAGWCLTGSASATCARFFGGIIRASKYALMWQWSGGGGSSNGRGDFHQIDNNRTP